MKLIISLLLACLLLTAFTCGEKTLKLDDSERAEIVEAVKSMTSRYFEDFHANNVDTVLRHYDTSACFFWSITPDTIALKRSAMVTMHRHAIKDYAKFEGYWSNIQVEPLTKELAMYHGTYHVNTEDKGGKKGKITGVETGVMVKREDGWKYLAGQTCEGIK
ncbi:MAG: nuclear transport factor 2 family protein [Ignavibacteria bacterium]|jgi:ketosteroid isomerase-like protein|nr:nuclear transport factor 2 family protein [Ignavibacteria bacterium]